MWDQIISDPHVQLRYLMMSCKLVQSERNCPTVEEHIAG